MIGIALVLAPLNIVMLFRGIFSWLNLCKLLCVKHIVLAGLALKEISIYMQHPFLDVFTDWLLNTTLGSYLFKCTFTCNTSQRPKW